GDAFRLGFGGTFSIESPAPYSATAKALITELGIDVPSYPKYVNRDLYRSLGMQVGLFLDKETFGADKLTPNPVHVYGDESGVYSRGSSASLRSFLADAPVSDKAKADLQRLLKDDKDYFPGITSDEKKAKLARISYKNYLTETVGVSEEIVKI